MAMFLAAAECVPAILILVSMWKKILEINWKTRRESSTVEEAKLNDSETIPGTNGATPRGMEAVNQAIKSLLSAVEIPVFAGAWLAVLIIGEINFFSDQLAYHTEPIGSIGQWGTILGTGMAGLGSFYVWAADSKQELAQNQTNGRICSHCHGSRERRCELYPDDTISPQASAAHQEFQERTGFPDAGASTVISKGEWARRRKMAHWLGKVGNYFGNPAEDPFGAGNFKTGEWPHIPGERNRNSQMAEHDDRYSIMDGDATSVRVSQENGSHSDGASVAQSPASPTSSESSTAEVIKIEHPTRGDDTRAWGPPYATYRVDSKQDGPGESAYFLAVNRNKKSLGLNFQHPDGTKILHELVSKCDILVENYLPGTLKKYKLDYDTLRAINPGLIYASITGYGQTGPYSQRAGYDVMVEAEFGLMHITGSRDGPPVKVGVAVTDLTTGLYTSNSIMAALLARGKTSKGQHIDVALSDCQTATLANIASSCLISGKKDSGRWGTAHPSIVPYRSFKTSNGDILFGGGNDRLYGILCDGLNKPEWKDDPKYKTNAQRVANRVELEALIEKITVTKTTEEWLQVFEGKGMPYAAVNDVQGALEHEHTKARNMVVEMKHDECGPIRMVNTPVKYSESEPTIRTAPPTLGQHTHEVLGEHLGFTEERIRDLKSGGVIG
ncbi:Succinate--hydroxymethylglutarate CoA-transferase [Colletotrichum trifolii]|uniref:Succinate--hydroxymethylglutarate CoA-transferase n=1 Tax=Colletotrichum trifolii TaxID=5466 RepID=A0A4R8RQ03_COLTR|nr:Succinate--hydroxymethylglutarate CoA-transferase [Colletotrichum trifolii]